MAFRASLASSHNSINLPDNHDYDWSWLRRLLVGLKLVKLRDRQIGYNQCFALCSLMLVLNSASLSVCP